MSKYVKIKECLLFPIKNKAALFPFAFAVLFS